MNPESITETYAAIKLTIGTRRWAGVPFYLRAGKRLGRRVTEIAVVFKRAPQQLFADSQTSQLGQNALVIRVQPDEGVTIRFGSKVPGAGMQVRDVTMDFGYGHAFTEASPEAYERLILDVLLGDPPLFPRHEEVELSWKILDPIEEFWATQGQPEQYRPGTWGPAPPTICWPATAASGGVHDRRPAQHHHQPGLEGARQDPRGERGRRARPRADPRHRRRRTGVEEEAIEAANDASREHPMRVIVVSTDADDAARRARASTPRSVSAATPAPARSSCCAPAAHGRTDEESLVMGLLLPDAPVVTWWPGRAPACPGTSPLGRIAHRRITDASAPAGPAGGAAALADNYTPGDTDFAWTRLTLWRAQLAAVLDQPPYAPVTAVQVTGSDDSPSTTLLAAWLH